MVAADSAPSRALLEANRRLYQLRKARGSFAARQTPHVTSSGAEQSSATAKKRAVADLPINVCRDLKAHVVVLPEHLGWESTAVTRAIRGESKRCADERGAGAGREAGAGSATCETAQDKGSGVTDEATIKLYPDIALAILQQELAAVGRLWLLLRYLDQTGQGWLRIDRVRRNLAQKDSMLRICGQRQLRNLLKQGRGVFWEQDKERLWLRSATRVAKALGVTRLTGRPVALPLEALLGGIGQVRAHFYASFHSGRRSNGPVSRAKLKQLTGVPTRTQRIYEATAGVTSRRNIAIGKHYSQKEAQERAWRHGQGTFEFVDTKGLQGPVGRRYVAWQLPNSYEGCHATSPKGRQKKINRQIDLVNIRVQGNNLDRAMSREKFDRIFHVSGLEAGRSYDRNGHDDAYWIRTKHSSITRSVQMWHVVPGRNRRSS